MILLGLTGGIGSGKSSVAQLLLSRGAIVIDSDAIARELQAAGSPLLEQLVDRFGDVLNHDGSLDRAKLASIVFPSPENVKALNAIMHPAIGKEMSDRLDSQRTTNNIVVLDIPLLVENPRKGLSGVVVVDVDPEVAIQRVVEHRGMNADDVRARIARQSTREQRREIADQVIDNAGTLDDLERQVDSVWNWAKQLPPAASDAGSMK
jgi:dephospho-CoA kinase